MSSKLAGTLLGVAEALGQQQQAFLIGNGRHGLAPGLVIDENRREIGVLAVHARLFEHRIRVGPQFLDAQRRHRPLPLHVRTDHLQQRLACLLALRDVVLRLPQGLGRNHTVIRHTLLHLHEGSQIRNSKLEIRNKFKIQSTNDRNISRLRPVLNLGFSNASDLFRISNFVLQFPPSFLNARRQVRTSPCPIVCMTARLTHGTPPARWLSQNSRGTILKLIS